MFALEEESLVLSKPGVWFSLIYGILRNLMFLFVSLNTIHLIHCAKISCALYLLIFRINLLSLKLRIDGCIVY